MSQCDCVKRTKRIFTLDSHVLCVSCDLSDGMAHNDNNLDEHIILEGGDDC